MMAGDTRNSSFVVSGSPEHPIERGLQRAITKIEHLNLKFEVQYTKTRIGLIGEHIGSNPKGLLAMAKTLDMLGLPPQSVACPYEGNALSIITENTNVPNAIRTLHQQVYGF